MTPATLRTFEAAYGKDADPWRTFTSRDEAVKRDGLLHALGSGRWARVLELGAGVGANRIPLADRSLRLDATDGAEASVRLIRDALGARERARALHLAVPARFPRPTYDAIVIAELLYYLSPRDMAAVARATGRALRPGGRLILAHHRIQFHDFAQPAAGIHDRFLRQLGRRLRPSTRPTRSAKWIVESFDG